MVSRAVSELHNCGWVHANLRPGNLLLVDGDGGSSSSSSSSSSNSAITTTSWRIKLSDMGLLHAGTNAFNRDCESERTSRFW